MSIVSTQAEVDECLSMFKAFVSEVNKQLSHKQLDLRVRPAAGLADFARAAIAVVLQLLLLLQQHDNPHEHLAAISALPLGSNCAQTAQHARTRCFSTDA